MKSITKKQQKTRYLALHKEWQAKIKNSKSAPGGRHLVDEQLVTQCVQEALRLAPPAPLTSRVFHDPPPWGTDAKEGKTEVMVDWFGAARRTRGGERRDDFHPGIEMTGGNAPAVFPFGLGPHACPAGTFHFFYFLMWLN